jgi:hypothetical protein
MLTSGGGGLLFAAGVLLSAWFIWRGLRFRDWLITLLAAVACLGFSVAELIHLASSS